MDQIDGKSVFHVSVFSGDLADQHFAGTEAVVFLEDQALSDKDMLSIARRKLVPATCFVWPGDKPNAFNIRFFNSEQEIEVCGHGLLAAAKVLTDKLSDEQKGQQADAIEFITQSSHISTRMNDKDQLWIGFDAIDSEPIDIPVWAEDCCNIKPAKASKVGASDGYLIFEWPQGFDLTELRINFDKLTFATQRALIATTESQAEGFDYDMRYFAPQHGVNEDKATGSANRVLASYWKSILKQRKFKARQLSVERAVIEAECQNGTVWISGKVVINA